MKSSRTGRAREGRPQRPGHPDVRAPGGGRGRRRVAVQHQPQPRRGAAEAAQAARRCAPGVRGVGAHPEEEAPGDHHRLPGAGGDPEQDAPAVSREWRKWEFVTHVRMSNLCPGRFHANASPHLWRCRVKVGRIYSISIRKNTLTRTH